MASSYGNHDAAACARYFSALALALAGEEKRARSTAENALAIARSLNDPFSMALTLYFASATAQVLGDVTLAAQHAEASRRMATEHDLATPRAWSTGIIGWCAAESGDTERGIRLLTEARVARRAFSEFHVLSPRIIGASAHARRAPCRCDESRRGGNRASRYRRRALLQFGTPPSAG